MTALYHENTSTIPALGRSCKDIKTTHPSLGDDLYWLDPDGGNQSNAFLAYCDMTSYNGGWTMCYTTDFKADPRNEIAYNPQNPYGTVGYRTDCNNILVSRGETVSHLFVQDILLNGGGVTGNSIFSFYSSLHDFLFPLFGMVFTLCA